MPLSLMYKFIKSAVSFGNAIEIQQQMKSNARNIFLENY